MSLHETGAGPGDASRPEGEDTWTVGDHGLFVYVPLGWRTGRCDAAQSLAQLYVEDALQELHACYAALPIPDRILDLVGRDRSRS